jgi:hypothetical protein
MDIQTWLSFMRRVGADRKIVRLSGAMQNDVIDFFPGYGQLVVIKVDQEASAM